MNEPVTYLLNAIAESKTDGNQVLISIIIIQGIILGSVSTFITAYFARVMSKVVSKVDEIHVKQEILETKIIQNTKDIDEVKEDRKIFAKELSDQIINKLRAMQG